MFDALGISFVDWSDNTVHGLDFPLVPFSFGLGREGRIVENQTRVALKLLAWSIYLNFPLYIGVSTEW